MKTKKFTINLYGGNHDYNISSSSIYRSRLPPKPPSRLSSAAEHSCRLNPDHNRVQRRRQRQTTRSPILLTDTNGNNRACAFIIRKNRREASNPCRSTSREFRSEGYIWNATEPLIWGRYAFVVRKTNGSGGHINNRGSSDSNGRGSAAAWDNKEIYVGWG